MPAKTTKTNFTVTIEKVAPEKAFLESGGFNINERPAIGPNTVTNQLAPDTGIDENGTVPQLLPL